MSQITVNKRSIYLGTFDNPEAAVQAYVSARAATEAGKEMP